MRAAAPLKEALERRVGMGEFAGLLVDWLRSLDGSIGKFFQRAGGRLRPRARGVAVDRVFPLPWLVYRENFDCSSGSESSVAKVWANIWIGLLNSLYGEREQDICDNLPSAAQERLQLSLLERAVQLLRECSDVDMSGGEIR